MVNPFDEIAIEEALQMRERGEVNEVVGVCITTEEGEEQIRHALAMGLDRAVRVDDPRSLDSYAVSRVLKAVVLRERPELVLMGKQAIDSDGNQTGQMLAGLLSWPQATFASKIGFVDDGRRIECVRETDRGLVVIRVDMPAVVTADLRLNEPRYVSLPGLMKARRRPIEVLTLVDIELEGTPLTTTFAVDSVPKRGAGVRLETVDELVERLRTVDRVL
jgi:electron transfer flavoprotein beta subunit